MSNPTRFTERELDLMAVLWKAGSGTVAEVRDALDDDTGYTTVLKLLQILEQKGAVRHEREGRAYRYFPVTGAEEASAGALSRLVDTVFQGSSELLLARLLSERTPTPEEVERMREILDELEEDVG